MEDNWFRDGDYWRKPSPQWEIDIYGMAVDGKGDLISNTCMKIIEDKDYSNWARNALTDCMDLLYTGKRWPDRMNQSIDGNLYRKQTSMTRDPHIYWICCCVHLGAVELIEEVKIPWKLYSPSVFAWRKYLINPNRWSEFIYKLHPQGRKDYVKRLSEFMYNAYYRISQY